MKTLLRVILFGALAVCTASCSRDDGSEDPAGTITINMLDEGNGKTLLGNSDVYIDKAGNFNSRYCLIAPLGKKKGLGSLPVPALDGLNSKVAVEPGNAYQVFKDAAVMKFPSGALALSIGADYYNVYVASQIKQSDEVTGAVVKFKLEDVPGYGLPEYDSYLGELSYPGDELAIDLPGPDFEYYPDDSCTNVIEYRKQGSKLIIRLDYCDHYDNFGVYVRYRGSYTYVYGRAG